MINVDNLIGAKYKLHGRTKEEGFDCYGLVMAVEKKLGNELPDFDYKVDSYELFLKYYTEMLNAKKVKKINAFVEGAILLFSNSNGLKNHIGVYVGDGFFVHCNYSGVHLDKVTSLSADSTEIFVWRK